MDVLFKGCDLLFTQITCSVRILLAIPVALLHALFVHPLSEWLGARSSSGSDASRDDPGCIFYEGVVKHARRRPVANAFE